MKTDIYDAETPIIEALKSHGYSVDVLAHKDALGRPASYIEVWPGNGGLRHVNVRIFWWDQSWSATMGASRVHGGTNQHMCSGVVTAVRTMLPEMLPR